MFISVVNRKFSARLKLSNSVSRGRTLRYGVRYTRKNQKKPLLNKISNLSFLILRRNVAGREHG